MLLKHPTNILPTSYLISLRYYFLYKNHLFHKSTRKQTET